MGPWIRYFVGTPRRLLTTLIVISFVAVLIDPSILTLAVNRLVNALAPLLGDALAILIVFAGIKMIFSGGKKK